MKNQNTKNNKGITLVVLIITIIVLLILAVVTIGAVQEDGIIGKAKYARDEYEKAQAKENSILQGYLDQLNDNTLYGNGGTGNTGNENFGNGTTEEGNTGDESTENENNGDESVEDPFKKVYVNDYGAPIEYSVDLNDDGDLTNDWRVFYKDDTHWYIIASDYLENTNLPTGLNMSTYSTYGAYWASRDDFTSENASTITSEVAEKYKLSWLEENSSSANDSARATADLLNVDEWTAKFGNAEKGIEAIGAPTLEMWVASWNTMGEKYGKDEYLEVKTEYDSKGYFVGSSAIESLSGIADNADQILGGYHYYIGRDTEGYNNELYFPHRGGYLSSYGYWLASPGSSETDSVIAVDCDTAMIGAKFDWGDGLAVRPLVSVPSELITSDVDGSFRVVE